MIRPILAYLFVFVFCFALYAEEQNTIIVTENGLEMFEWDLEFVRHAKHSIEISPVFLGGKVARELFAAIEKRLEEIPQLQVYILTAIILLELEDWELIKHLQQKYPHNFHLAIAVSVPILWPDVSAIDNHIKMVVVDEKYFSTGGTNLDENQATDGKVTPARNPNKMHVVAKNLPAAMRDQDIVGRGPLAIELRKTFYKLFSLWENYNKTGIFERDLEKFSHQSHYFAVMQKAYVKEFENSKRRRNLEPGQIKLIVGGAYQNANAITQEYVHLIDQAEEEIIIANLYFCPVDPIFQALLAAVNRGVKLTILTNGNSELTPEYAKFFCWANRIHYVPVLYGSVFHFWDAWNVANREIKNTRLFEYHLKDVLFHKKTMVVDSRYAIIGSYNLGYRSHMGDYEMVVSLDSEEVVRDLQEVHATDLKLSREVSPAEARRWYFDPVTASLGEMQKKFHGLL